MKNRFLISLAAFLILSVLIGIIYLNNYLLPLKIKALMIKAFTDYSGQAIDIGSLKYTPFKGIVIQDLTIYEGARDANKKIVRIKEASFNTLIIPIFKEKKIIIPVLHINSPRIFIEYRQDKTFNVACLLPKKKAPSKKSPFSLFILKVNIYDGEIAFQDQNTMPVFSKVFSKLNCGIGLNIPKEIKLILRGKISQNYKTPANADITSAYDLATGALTAKLKFSELKLTDYSQYYRLKSLVLSDGIASQAEIDYKYANGLLSINGQVKTRDLILQKNKLSLKGDIDIQPQISYSDATKKVDYKINFALDKCTLDGVFYLNSLKSITADIILEDNKLSTEKATLDTLGLRFNLKGTLENFQNPTIITNITAPDINIDSDIKITKDIIHFNSIKANLFQGSVEATGEIDMAVTNNPSADMEFNLNINPKDIARLFPEKIKKFLDKTKLDGSCNITGNIQGRFKDFKYWDAHATLSSKLLSLHNFNLSDVLIELNQRDGFLKIKDAHAKYYAADIILGGSSNLMPDEQPFDLKASFSNIDLSKAKDDLGFQKKNISGLLNLKANLDGALSDLNKLRGEGRIYIKEGNLWELNLFKGLGEFLFLPIYTKIVFKEGSCDFLVQNKEISTDDLLLASDQVALTGEGKINSDGKIDFTLNTEINEKTLTQSKDIRRFTTAIAGGMLVSHITGTLKEPKYSLTPLPINELKKAKDFLFGK